VQCLQSAVNSRIEYPEFQSAYYFLYGIKSIDSLITLIIDYIVIDHLFSDNRYVAIQLGLLHGYCNTIWYEVLNSKRWLYVLIPITITVLNFGPQSVEVTGMKLGDALIE